MCEEKQQARIKIEMKRRKIVTGILIGKEIDFSFEERFLLKKRTFIYSSTWREKINKQWQVGKFSTFGRGVREKFLEMNF